MQCIDYYTESGLAVVTLSESDKGNRLHGLMLKELLSVFRTAQEDPEVRVILLRSNGSVFCLGMDLSQVEEYDGEKDDGRGIISLYTDLLFTIYTMAQPVVCVLHGQVKAGGVGLSSACDIVLSSEKTTFELGEVFFGLIPANVLPFIFGLRLTPQKARYMILTAKSIDASEAQRNGLVDEVYEGGIFEKKVREMIKQLMRLSPDALREAKLFTYELLNYDLKALLEKTERKLFALARSQEVKEAVKAFREGGVPPWFARFKNEKPLVLKGEEEWTKK